MNLMQIRLVPAVVFIAGLMLSIQLGGIFVDFLPSLPESYSGQVGGVRVSSAQAQSADENAEVADLQPVAENAVESEEDQSFDMQMEIETSKKEGGLSPVELRLIHDLRKRRKALEERERVVSAKEILLEAVEKKLIRKQKTLEKVRTEIGKLVVQYEERLDKENAKLRDIYSTMKPKSAAAIFNDLELSTLLDVAKGINARKLAPILAAMNPEKARLVTQKLAIKRELPKITP